MLWCSMVVAKGSLSSTYQCNITRDKENKIYFETKTDDTHIYSLKT